MVFPERDPAVITIPNQQLSTSEIQQVKSENDYFFDDFDIVTYSNSDNDDGLHDIPDDNKTSKHFQKSLEKQPVLLYCR